MKKDVITLEKITYKNYVKVLFGLNVNKKQKESDDFFYDHPVQCSLSKQETLDFACSP